MVRVDPRQGWLCLRQHSCLRDRRPRYRGVENRYLDGPADSYSEKNTKIGWTIGAGLEQAITDHWSANAEYRYVDLRDQTINYAPNSSTTFDNTFSTVRIGMNYKF
ncbi:outer membrane beta-barrel protein [Mesorhizobium australicum]|uniref:outer membrane protein n=1 Tax=Mesorhizobium australicum TaxID=536018 RepID=UPI00333818FB